MLNREQWWMRGVLIASVVLLHLMLFLTVTRNRHKVPTVSGPPMFGPVVSQVWRDIRQRSITSKEWTTGTSINNSTAPAQQWTFPPIDIWSSLHQKTTLTDFTPVTAAEPIESEIIHPTPGKASPNRSNDERTKLRMTRWSRPVYSIQQALDGQKGAVSIELDIDRSGTVVHASIVESSGFDQLDRVTLDTARTWRFALPLWEGNPVAVSARMQIRYH